MKIEFHDEHGGSVKIGGTLLSRDEARRLAQMLEVWLDNPPVDAQFARNLAAADALGGSRPAFVIDSYHAGGAYRHFVHDDKGWKEADHEWNPL